VAAYEQGNDCDQQLEHSDDDQDVGLHFGFLCGNYSRGKGRDLDDQNGSSVKQVS
jgi:hypothetical protein